MHNIENEVRVPGTRYVQLIIVKINSPIPPPHVANNSSIIHSENINIASNFKLLLFTCATAGLAVVERSTRQHTKTVYTSIPVGKPCAYDRLIGRRVAMSALGCPCYPRWNRTVSRSVNRIPSDHARQGETPTDSSVEA